MIHFDAKHQKSEAKTKVKQAKIKRKNRSEMKIKRQKLIKMFFFFTRNEIGKRHNAKNIEFCFFWSKKVFPLVSLRSDAKYLKQK